MYQHILFASDFSPEAERAETRAVELAQQSGARLSVIHVIDYFPVHQLDGGLSLVPDLEHQINENARQELQRCTVRIPLKTSNAYICSGSARREIIDYARHIEADLIVMGSHGRHGLGLLLGSTATGVLHGAQCDVLAVRVRE